MPEIEPHTVQTSGGEPTQPVADEVLLGSVALAQRALLENTPPETVGSVIGHIAEDEHVLTLLFAADLPGYRGWHWSVTIARVEGAEPTVLETELMPGEQALLAPEWVPWSERLAEYRAAQEQAAAEASERGDEDEGDVDDLDDDALGDADGYEGDLDDPEGDDEFDGDDHGDDEFDGIDIDALADPIESGGADGFDGADEDDAGQAARD
ncbi:DUF3027 domain-containing protein [Agromyces sp. G08B096]|uniref:DUF3027 domain-containing protein n=1 Tax=Agromyces sp. G08B096 TaxID=3156399 RepID=A0AAU7WA32_9MICO